LVGGTLTVVAVALAAVDEVLGFLAFLVLECAALDLTLVVVVERGLGLVVVVAKRTVGFLAVAPRPRGLVVVVVERPRGLVVVVTLLPEPFVVGGDLVVGTGSVDARPVLERPLFFDGGLVEEVVGRGRVVEVVVEATRLVLVWERRLALVLGGACLGLVVEVELLGRVVEGDRRPLPRRVWGEGLVVEGGLVVDSAVVLVVAGAVLVVDNGNEVNGTTATRVVGGATVVVEGALLVAGLFFAWGFFLADGVLRLASSFLALWGGLGGCAAVVNVGYGTAVPRAPASVATPLANASVVAAPLMAPPVRSS
jgi:hypothetical protein